MFELDQHLFSLRRRIQRLLGNTIELIWIRGCSLDPILGKTEWIEQVILEMAVRARAALSCGGRLAIESCNLDLDELSAAAEALTAGRYVMFEMTCLRQLPQSNSSASSIPFSTEFEDHLHLDSDLARAIDILHAIGGNIREYNEPGRALTLRAFFPSSAMVVTPAEESLPANGSAAASTTLLVEDESCSRDH